ncbi:MAG: hypothetical protein ACLR56_15465 [Oscillospiraceae bacterium]
MNNKYADTYQPTVTSYDYGAFNRGGTPGSTDFLKTAFALS